MSNSLLQLADPRPQLLSLRQRHDLLIRVQALELTLFHQPPPAKQLLDERQLRRATRLMPESGSQASNTCWRFSSAVNRRRFPGCGPSITSIPSGS
jgi:hypothetical protein